ncbi:MAG: hypothetical protein ACRDRO_12695 [Pseudonocardiaceae bacterium]
MKLDINYTDTNGQTLPRDGSYKNCKVDFQDPAMNQPVHANSSVMLDVINCDPPSESKKPGGSSGTDTGTKGGHKGK